MVSAELLAEMDMKLRDCVAQVAAFKRGCENMGARPFGGLNVLMAGDLWQIPPPQGAFLGRVPTEWLREARKYTQRPTAAGGQSLLWAGPQQKQFAFHGVTELEESERCKNDPWLQEVQLEMRQGTLSQDNHVFLHVLPTSVPGSWALGEAQCGDIACGSLVAQGATPEAIQKRECERCRLERQEKRCVATDALDARFSELKFVEAPAIFPNNDVKYDVGKRRAQLFARARGLAIAWCAAKDKPSPETLRQRPNMVGQKASWLRRHDRECGDLPGMFPLVSGLPVALAEHIDRNPEKQLLRGKIGRVHSWLLDDAEASAWEDGTRVLRRLPTLGSVVITPTLDSPSDGNLVTQVDCLRVAPKSAAPFALVFAALGLPLLLHSDL